MTGRRSPALLRVLSLVVLMSSTSRLTHAWVMPARALKTMASPTAAASRLSMTASGNSNPSTPSLSRRALVQTSLGVAATGLLGSSAIGGGAVRRASAATLSASSEFALPDDAYTLLGGDMKSCKILNGMWQLSGGHGYRPQVGPAVSDMRKSFVTGFTTFDTADIYGGAEDVVGSYKREYGGKDDQGLFYTKWVPRPERLSRAAAKEAIGRSMKRMDTTQLDLLQFHWWEYGYPYYMDALQYLQEIQQDGGIRHLALTNFDTKHMNEIYDAGIKIVSNQVQYSLLDQRPSVLMAPAMLERNMQILAYGTLLGGFFSENWKGKDDPKGFETVSQQKYYNMIRTWGDWGLFQELLVAMDKVAKKHEVSISNVAVRWVLEQPAVGGAIVGCRFGLKGKEHAEDNKRVFSFKLDEEDKMGLKAVTSKAKDLMKVIGDCGGEYRRA